MTATTAADRPRRTQHERRSATQQALLDASLACLLEDGYAGLTTRRVAVRAGVAPATLRFYLPSRAAFVAAAVEQLAIELRRQLEALPLRSAAPVVRFRGCLDELWQICNGATFLVMIELASAARGGDQQAQDGFAVAERGVTRQIAASAGELFPDDIADPRFRTLIELATAAMRGLAMFQPVTEQSELDKRWKAICDELTASYARIVDERR